MRKILVIILAVFLCMITMGCSNIQQKAKEIAIDWKADGREYGKETTYTIEDTIQTAFFKVKVNSVTTQDEIQGENDEYVPQDVAHQFIVVNITVENTYDDFDSITMFCDDFELTWEQLEGETTFPEYQMNEEQLPDSYELKYGESKTGNLVFITPRNIKDYRMKYYEIWDDNFIGNTYYIDFSVAE